MKALYFVTKYLCFINYAFFIYTIYSVSTSHVFSTI
jgi:hypothetical protein